MALQFTSSRTRSRPVLCLVLKPRRGRFACRPHQCHLELEATLPQHISEAPRFFFRLSLQFGRFSLLFDFGSLLLARRARSTLEPPRT